MAEKMTTAELINLILGNEQDKQLEEEEMIHLLVEHKVSKNMNKVQNEERLSFGAKAADGIAKFAGSWTFIIIFVSCLLLWIGVNAYILRNPFDVYPFILLNLVLSCVAALQAPVIMMSQNRQEEKDRLRSQNDYKTNLKSELIIEDLHHKLDQILENQERIAERLSKCEKSE